MIPLRQLTIAASFMVMAAVAMSPVSPQDQPYSSINFYGKRPQPVYQHESIAPSTEPTTVEELSSHASGPSKVIIRPASSLSTLPPLQNQKKTETENDGCKCEPIDTCPIELMDFRFAVSCEYGTVRCCRPLEPVIIKTTTSTKPVVVTPASAHKWPKKTSSSCRCKLRKDCDRLFQLSDEQAVERKIEMTCPSGSVRCCETGNTKTDAVPEKHILGGNDFRPVQLPFPKMPTPADERISEQDPRPSDQELEPIENATPAVPVNTSSDILSIPTSDKQEQQENLKLELEQSATPVQPLQQRPVVMPQEPVGNQFGPPLPIRQQIQPLRNPNFNPPLNQGPSLPLGSPLFSQQLPNQPHITHGFQPMQTRPNMPFRPQINQQMGQTQFPSMAHSGSPPLFQQMNERPFQLQPPPMMVHNTNQQSNTPLQPQLMPPMQLPPVSMQAPINVAPQHHLVPPMQPPANLQQRPTSNGGSFFSSFMNMFN